MGALTEHAQVNVTSKNNWWTVNMKGAYYGITDINADDTVYAFVDTGTSLLLMSDTDFSVFAALI